MKQLAYAKNILGGKSPSKKIAALNSGYSPAVANSVATHIEKTKGFNNAMAKLAHQSNNLAMEAMHEFKARGFKDFSDKNLIGALNAIGSAWTRFNESGRKPNQENPTGNRLRTVVLQQIENQNVTSPTPTVSEVADKPTPVAVEVEDVDNPMDF